MRPQLRHLSGIIEVTPSYTYIHTRTHGSIPYLPKISHRFGANFKVTLTSPAGNKRPGIRHRLQEQSESFRTVPWSSRSASRGPVRTPRKHPVPGGLFLCVSEWCFGPGEAPGRAGELRRSAAGLTRPWERPPTPWNGRGGPTGAPGPPSGSQRIYTRRPPPGGLLLGAPRPLDPARAAADGQVPHTAGKSSTRATTSPPPPPPSL